MIKYPIDFYSKTVAREGTSGTWSTESGAHMSHCSVPVEFLGSGGALSPEDLFNHALTNCFVATFKVYAENSKLNFASVSVQSKLVVDLDDQKKPVMKAIHLDVKIYDPSNTERALLLAKKASESGFILNSVKTEKHFKFEVLAAGTEGEAE
jgi:organic hydroperoxide reductase OsmC/OhrA